MRVEYSCYTDKGGRKNNEDYLGIAGSVYIVADGLGGHSCGEVASKELVEYLKGKYSGISDFGNESMHEIIEDVNSYIWKLKQEKPEYENMASTVVAAFIENGVFNYLNVGDSRLYYFRKNKIYLRSKDHSITQALVDMKEIKEKQMRFHEDRNKLTKVIGIKEKVKIKDVFTAFPIETGDAFLLCSDGFWEYVLEKEMVKCLKRSKSPEEWMQKMLVFHAKRVDGNHDNNSAVCVKITEK